MFHCGVGERPIQRFRRKTAGRNPLGTHKCRWQNNITIDLHEMICENMDWVDLAQDRDRWQTLVTTVTNIRFPLNAGNCLNS